MRRSDRWSQEPSSVDTKSGVPNQLWLVSSAHRAMTMHLRLLVVMARKDHWRKLFQVLLNLALLCSAFFSNSSTNKFLQILPSPQQPLSTFSLVPLYTVNMSNRIVVCFRRGGELFYMPLTISSRPSEVELCSQVPATTSTRPAVTPRLLRRRLRVCNPLALYLSYTQLTTSPPHSRRCEDLP